MSLTASHKGKEKAIVPEHDQNVRVDNAEENEPSSSSSTSENSDSDSESTSSGGSESSEYDSDFAPPDPAYLESLLEKEKQNIESKVADKKKAGFLEQDEIRLDDGLDKTNDVEGCVFPSITTTVYV